MGVSRQEHWNGLPFPSPGDLPHPWIEHGFLHCKQTLYQLSHHESPMGAQCALVQSEIELVTKVDQDQPFGSQSQGLSGTGLFSLQSGASPSQTRLPCTGVWVVHCTREPVLPRAVQHACCMEAR